MTQPTPPYVDADLNRATTAINALWETSGTTARDFARAALDALAQAGRLADQQPTAPHITAWLRTAAANDTPGRPDDITRLRCRAAGWDVRTEWGVRLQWNGHTEDIPRPGQAVARRTVALHTPIDADQPTTAVLITRTHAVSPWTETTEEPQP